MSLTVYDSPLPRGTRRCVSHTEPGRCQLCRAIFHPGEVGVRPRLASDWAAGARPVGQMEPSGHLTAPGGQESPAKGASCIHGTAARIRRNGDQRHCRDCDMEAKQRKRAYDREHYRRVRKPLKEGAA